jgi:hypothetical protein
VGVGDEVEILHNWHMTDDSWGRLRYGYEKIFWTVDEGFFGGGGIYLGTIYYLCKLLFRHLLKFRNSNL